MTNLEPDVLLRQWSGRILDDVFKALMNVPEISSRNGLQDDPLRDSGVLTYLQTLHVLLLLLVDYTEPEVDFASLLKVRLHAHDL